MSWRRLPPAHTPVPLGAIVGAVPATLAGGAGDAQSLARALASEFGAACAVLTASGTDALTLALASLGSSPRVALPAYACYDLVTAALGARARVRWYDVRPETLGPDWPSLERACADGIDAVVIAHLFGVPVDAARAEAIAQAAGGVLVDDAAQGAGTRTGGRPAGGTGAFGVLSFGRGKGRGGAGGGALLCRDAAAAERIAAAAALAPSGRGLTALAVTAGMWLLGRPALFGLPASVPALRLGETVFHPPHAPAAISAGSAAVARRAWAAGADAASGRRAMAARWREALGSRLEWPAAERADDVAGWLRRPALAPAGGRARWLDAGRARGLMPGYPIALPRLPEAAPLGATDGAWPGAERLASSLLTLPTHRWVTDAVVDSVVATVVGS